MGYFLAEPVIIILLLFASGLSPLSARSPLHRLDALVNDGGKAVMRRASQLDSLNLAGYCRAWTPAQRYRHEINMGNRYSDFNIDSALTHFHRAQRIALATNDSLMLDEARLRTASLYNSAGMMYKEAYGIFTDLHPDKLPDSLRVAYYTLGIQLYRNLAECSLDPQIAPEYDLLKKQYRDSLLSLNPDARFIIVNKLIDEGNYASAKKLMDDELRSDTVIGGSAAAYHVMARIHALQGNRNEQIQCLANAAVRDLSNGVREYIALPELAVALYEQGDIDRAYRYLHRSIDDAAACNAKIRTMEMSNTMPLIDAAYNARQSRLRHSLHIAIGVVMVLAVLLGIAVRIVVKRNRCLRQSHDRQLDINAQLSAANKAKEEYMTRFMNLSLEFLSKMENYRSYLSKVANKRNFDQLYDAIASTRYIDKEINGFYALFDDTFLNLYPGFTDKVNALLLPDEQIKLKPGEKMNTELRICALMRLGICDGEQTARILRCSMSTVYNYRSKLRKKAIDPAEFEKKVSELV